MAYQRLGGWPCMNGTCYLHLLAIKAFFPCTFCSKYPNVIFIED